MMTLTRVLSWLGLSLLAATGAFADDTFKPFVLGFRGQADFDAKVEETRQALTANGFSILGEFTPYKDTFVDNTRVIVVTSDELKAAAQKTQYGGFAAPWRVAVTKIGDEVQVAYANPAYLANAYRLDTDLAGVSAALAKALGATGTFGSESGLTARKLRKYNYTFGMEHFDKVYELATYDSHQAAVDSIEKNLAKGRGGVSKVYRLDIANGVTLFGVARKGGGDDDKYMDDAFIMSVVDFGDLKGTAYLPYEIMVDGNKVVALHMRFRMAVQYPDLKMMGEHSFMKLMASPKAIEDALTKAAEAH